MAMSDIRDAFFQRASECQWLPEEMVEILLRRIEETEDWLEDPDFKFWIQRQEL
jgi:hypothetical protein